MKQHERGIISSPRQEAEVARVETQLTTSNVHVRLRPAVAQTNRSLHEKHGKQASAVTVETARIAAAQHRLFHRVRQVWPMSTFIKYLIPMAASKLVQPSGQGSSVYPTQPHIADHKMNDICSNRSLAVLAVWAKNAMKHCKI